MDTNENVEVEGVDTEVKPVLEDSSHKSTMEDAGRKSTISRIADILKGKKPEVTQEVADEPVEDEGVVESLESEDDIGDEPEETEHTAEYTEVDSRFVDVARRYGWSDDRIIAYAEQHDDRDLVMLTGMMEKAVPSKTEDVTDLETEKPNEYDDALKQVEGSDSIDDITKKLLKSLITDLKATQDQVKQVKTTQQEVVKTTDRDAWLGRLHEADELFDGISKEFPELGNTKTLKRFPDGSLNPNDVAVKVREDMFKLAVTLFNTGTPWDRAIKDALRWYKGGREDAVEAKVLQKIKNNSSRLTPKRERRHQVRKFANEQEEKASVVNGALQKHGIELPA